MNNQLYHAHFGAIPVRFVLIDGTVHVSKDDLFAIISDCFTEAGKQFLPSIFEKGLSMMGDADDRKPAILGCSEIGQAVHFHAAGNLILSLSELTDADNTDLRESSRQVRALVKWYIATLSVVDKHFDIGVMGMLHAVKDRLDRLAPPFVVEVTFDDGIYTACCDEIGLVTEEKTYEALTERVWAVVPDLIETESNDTGNIRIRFQQTQSTDQRRQAH